MDNEQRLKEMERRRLSDAQSEELMRQLKAGALAASFPTEL